MTDISRLARAAVKRTAIDRPIGLEKARNFLSKPPYEPGDKPRFDRGRFKTGTSVSSKFRPGKDDENSVDVDELVKVPGASGATLSAEWQGGNLANPNPAVKSKIGATKSYAELVRAAELVRVDVAGPYDETYTDRFHQKWRGPSKSYGDLRRHGKTRCIPDITYAQAAHREGERVLHDRIDKVAPTRRRQIKHRHQTNLQRWDRRHHQRKRLLYLLQPPRTWLELQFLTRLLACLNCSRCRLLLFEQPPLLRSWQFDKSTPISDEARARSKENDKRGTPKRQRVVFPSRAEELDLARRAKDGDVPARNRLFVAHWPLVERIARKHTGLGAETEDLIQEVYGGVNGDGNPVGIVYALDKFDPEKGVRFSTFARDAIEWAIKDYKKRQTTDMPPLNAAIIENAVDLGAHDEPEEGAKTIPRRTSRSIRRRATPGTMTVHISPYPDGLKPGTRDFIAEINAEAERLGTGVKYVATANKIEATGDILAAAARTDTLGGWALSRAIRDGYLDGEDAVLRKGNSQWRKELRKRVKRKLK